MKINTDSNGDLQIYDNYDNLVNINYVKSIDIDFGSCSEVSIVEATIKLTLSAVDIKGFCKGLDKNLKVFSICPECGKKRNDCEHSADTTPLLNQHIVVRDEENKALGYIQTIKIYQDEKTKPIISIKKYIRNESTDKVEVDENGEPKLFEY